MTVFSDDQRFEVATAIRDWIHEQSFSQCNAGSDTCPDWPMAYEIRDIALGALSTFDLTELTAQDLTALTNYYDLQADKAHSYAEELDSQRLKWQKRLALHTEAESSKQ
jgi:hypothetical protein